METFQKLHPNITIKSVSVGEQCNNPPDFTARLRGGTVTDVFTAELYAHGGQTTTPDGKSADFNNEMGKQVLQNLKDMRYGDNSMGSMRLLQWPAYCPRRRRDLRDDRRLEGLPLAQAGHAVAKEPHHQRRHLRLLRGHPDERGDAAAVIAAIPTIVFFLAFQKNIMSGLTTMRQDPMFLCTHGENPGRDGCRVPIPWSGAKPPFGFSPPGARHEPWLPQPRAWRDRTIEAQTGGPDSMLELYRRALICRHGQQALGESVFEWLPAPDSVLAFRRGRQAEFTCVVNLSARPAELPVVGTVVLRSGTMDNGRLPPGTTAWITRG